MEKILQAKLKDKEMENVILKNQGVERGWSLSGERQEEQYPAIKYLNETEQYPIKKLCEIIHIARSSYYKWLKRIPSHSQQINEQVVEWIKQH